MGIQVTKVINANAVKHGAIMCQGTGHNPLDQGYDADATPLPAVTGVGGIESKYDARFDDVRYYSGDTSA